LLHELICFPIEDDQSSDASERIEEKKEAIKEGVVTCWQLLRPSLREHKQTLSTGTTLNESKTKKIIIINKKKKTTMTNFNILHDDSDDDNDKENQSITPILNEDLSRRQTVRGSTSAKRTASSKQDENDDNESPPKRTKKIDDIDVPLPIISPAASKKTTNVRSKPTETGKEKKVTSIQFTRKIHSNTDKDQSTNDMSNDNIRNDEVIIDYD
jgi:hypothetical protein